MKDKLNINNIYDKNINFLIGSGASFGLFPTLALNVKGEDGGKQTIETLATLFQKDSDKTRYTNLFMHYYRKCIDPVLTFDFSLCKADSGKRAVAENYERFIETIISILQNRKGSEKNCNIFTTNYDGCFAYAADSILQKGAAEFIVNDGARGFSRRHLQARNFNSFVYQAGIFNRHRIEIPQINLIHLHGSAYWYKDGDNVLVDYTNKNSDRLIAGNLTEGIEDFSQTLEDESKTISAIKKIEIEEGKQSGFWGKYNALPIVNPTKWKFYETVFEEHYYQMLRFLSYELERQNSVFVTFGFSFADEHIRNLVKRSLSNPSLQVFICCFNADEMVVMKSYFKEHRNVQYICSDSSLDFSVFNNEVFTLTTQSEGAPVAGGNPA